MKICRWTIKPFITCYIGKPEGSQERVSDPVRNVVHSENLVEIHPAQRDAQPSLPPLLKDPVPSHDRVHLKIKDVEISISSGYTSLFFKLSWFIEFTYSTDIYKSKIFSVSHIWYVNLVSTNKYNSEFSFL